MSSRGPGGTLEVSRKGSSRRFLMNEYCDSGQCPAQARVTVFTRQRPAVHVRAPFPPALRRARAARVRRVRHGDRPSDPLPRAGLASLSMCEYPHVVVTGASSGAGRAVALCLAASGYHVYAGVRTHAERRRAAPAHAARRRPDHPAAARRQPPDPGHGRRAGRHRAHRPGRPRRAGERRGHGRLRPAARGQRHRRARRHPGVRTAAAPGPGPDRARSSRPGPGPPRRSRARWRRCPRPCAANSPRGTSTSRSPSPGRPPERSPVP